jgi:hypothetical protein
LKKWQPKDVVNILLQEVDANVASTYTLSMSKRPVVDGETLEAIANDEQREWVTLGTQIGFDAKELGALWNALSSVALHAQLPRSKEDYIPDYGDITRISDKVAECLDEFRRLAKGTLLGTGVGEEVSFDCACGKKIRRKANLLRNGQILNCIDPQCVESWRAEIKDGEYSFERRQHGFTCKKCSSTCSIPMKPIEKLKHPNVLYVDCLGENCDQRFLVAWRPMETQVDRPPTS